MRTALVFVVILLAAATARGLAPAEPFQGPAPVSGACVPLARAVLDSFPPPGAVPRGLDWDPDAAVLYHCDDDDEGGTVYSITPDGVATLLFDVSAQTGHRHAGATDLCLVRDDSLGVDYLYVVDYMGGKDTNDIVYQFTLDGTLVEEYPLVGVDPVCSGVMGITFDGEFFWLSCLLTSEIVKCDMEFAAIDTFSHPAGTGGGMDFDPESRRLYLTDYFEGNVYVTDRSLQVVDVFPAHPVAFQMVGVAIGRTGRQRTVWTSCYNPSWRYIYEIEDEYYNSPVEGMSWGMIKSLYR
jgi:sugar lactone lactonase YvrE